MTRLQQIMLATGMTREQIRRAVATGYGTFATETYIYRPAEADERLAKLFSIMRETRQYLIPKITTPEEAGKLRRLIQKYCPVDTGALRDSFDDPWTVQIMPDGNIKIDSPLPYARIQDLGGTIHRVTADGEPYTIKIPAQHYVGKAILEYNASLAAEEQRVRQEQGIQQLGVAGMLQRGLAMVQVLQAAREAVS